MFRTKKNRVGHGRKQGRGRKPCRGPDWASEEDSHLPAMFVSRGERSRGSRLRSVRSPLTFRQSSSLGDWNAPSSAFSGSQSGAGSGDSWRKSSRAHKSGTLNRAVAYVYPEANATPQQEEVDGQNFPDVVLSASEGRAAVIADQCPVRPLLLESRVPSEILEEATDSSTDINKVALQMNFAMETGKRAEGAAAAKAHISANSKSKGQKQPAWSCPKKKHKLRSVASDNGEGGFLCIGGVKIFTSRADDWLETSDNLVHGEEEDAPLSRLNQRKRIGKTKFRGSSSRSDPSDETDGLSSDIDADIAEDYIASVEGDFMDVDGLFQTPGVVRQWLVDNVDESATSDASSFSSDDSRNEAVLKCDENVLLLSGNESGSNADEERDFKAGEIFLENLRLECTSDEEEGIPSFSKKAKPFSKSSIRKQIKQLKAGKDLPFQLPRGNMYSKKGKKAPGSKKWQRTELIARKRHERALLRGCDLSTINAEARVVQAAVTLGESPQGHTSLEL